MENKTECIPSVCLFCCKQISNKNYQHLQSKHACFLKFLSRFLNTEHKWHKLWDNFCRIDLPYLKVETCIDCKTVVDSFCDLYHQFKWIELQLQWKIQTLTRIMNMANGVPSRINNLKELLARSAIDDLQCDHPIHFEQFLNNRKSLVSICHRKLSKVFPKVCLTRLDSISKNSQQKQLGSVGDDQGESRTDWSRIDSPVYNDCHSLPEDDESSQMEIVSQENKHIPLDSQVSEHQSILPGSPDLNSSHNLATSVNEDSVECNESDNLLSEPSIKESDHIEESQHIKMEVDEAGGGNLTDEDNGITISDSPSDACKSSSNDKHQESAAEPPDKIHAFSCKYCQKSFPKQHNLSIHIRTAHPLKIGNYFCKVCNRRYPNYYSYLLHVKTLLHKQKLKIHNEIKSEKFEVEGNQIKHTAISKTRLTKSKRSCGNKPLSSKHFSGQKAKYNLRSRGQKRSTKTSPSGNSSSSESSFSEFESSLSSDEISSETSEEEVINVRKPRTPKPNKKRQSFFCYNEGCKYQIENELAFKDHQRLHEPGQYKCEFCDCIEVNALKLSLHEERKHCNKQRKRGYYYCARCPYYAQFKMLYINHFARVHLGFERSIKTCQICKVSMSKENQHFLLTHDTSKVNPENILKCTESNCEAYFTNKYGLLKHLQQVHDDAILISAEEQQSLKDNLVCKPCNKRFVTKRTLVWHRRQYHRQGTANVPISTRMNYPTFVCPVLECVKSFKTQEELQEHQKLHGKFVCQFCEMTKEYAPDLAEHELEHNVTGTISYTRFHKCPRCSFETRRKSAYITHHLEAHMGLSDKILACSICSKKFSQQSRLSKHKNFYHDLGNNQPGKLKPCAKCTSNFLTELQMWKHQLSRHEYIFCPETNCDGKFQKIYEFKEHRKLHSTFKCQFCDIETKYAPDLPIHELEHAPTSSTLQNVKCPRCAFTFKDRNTFITHHLATHMNLSEKGFVCTVCYEQLSTPQKRSSHFEYYHGTNKKSSLNAKIKCTLCPAYFRLEKYLKQHEQKMHSVIHVFRCPANKCKLKFKTEVELNDHKTWHGSFNCQFCSICMNYAPDLAKHETEQHVLDNGKSGSYKCSRCEFSIRNPHKFRCLNHFLESHLKIPAKVHRCPVCQHTTTQKRAMEDHIRSAHKTTDDCSTEQYDCELCPAKFAKAIQLAHHTLKVHKNNLSSVECKLCGKTLKNRNTLKSHMKIFHENTSAFACTMPNCNRRFQTKNELELHLSSSKKFHDIKSGKAQPDVEIHRCKICKRECKGIAALKNHMKVHREKKAREFKCDQCEKVFKAKDNLQVHQLYHKGPEHWQFMCSICSKKCVTKNVLQSHMRTHTKEKPFVCQVCGEKYAHRHNLRNHVNSKHKDAGVQDIPRKKVQRFYVSRKGKKLGAEFCFTKEQDKQANNSSDVSD